MHPKSLPYSTQRTERTRRTDTAARRREKRRASRRRFEIRRIERVGDLLARPLVMVVQVNDHPGQQQMFLAPFDWAPADRVLQTVEEPSEILCWPLAAHILGKSIYPLVGGTQGA